MLYTAVIRKKDVSNTFAKIELCTYSESVKKDASAGIFEFFLFQTGTLLMIMK